MEQEELKVWIEKWLLNRIGEGNRFEQFNRQFCYDLIRDYIKEAGYVQIKKGDLYFTKEQRSAPDWSAKYYEE